MGKTTKARAKVLRTRPEVARLRARGGFTCDVTVDGASIIAWCARVRADVETIVDALVEAADAGERRLIVVVPPDASIVLSPPHTIVRSSLSLAELQRGHEIGELDRFGLPSAVVADVSRDPQLLDVDAGGADGLLDIATGIVWKGEALSEKYDVERAAVEGNERAKCAPDDVHALVTALRTAVPRELRPHIAVAFHRAEDAVVLERVAVDDGSRTLVEGHGASLTLLAEILARPGVPVMTSSVDVLDALYDAGFPLPVAVEDPALACFLLNPDDPRPPPGLGRGLRAVLNAERKGHPVRLHLDGVLDELPEIHGELRDELARRDLLALFEDDVCRTAPVFAAIEREGFHVDKSNLDRDLADLEAEMESARAIVISGRYAWDFRNLDVVTAPKEQLAALVEKSDGRLPHEWRSDEAPLERLALFGNARAQAIQRLRGLDAVHRWMIHLTEASRLRSVMAPGATGRWYPHGDPLFSIPKHDTEAKKLRRHLVPEPGHVFVAGDYAAFEPRLLAHQSGDSKLVAACAAGEFYKNMMPLLGLADREILKQAMLAFMYGRSPLSFASALPKRLPEGHRLFEELTNAIPDAVRFRAHIHEQCKAEARSMGGWRRFRGVSDSDKTFARKAFNLLMQGSASDLLRKLLRDLDGVLSSDARLVHQEFDAVIVSCPAEMVWEVKQLVKATMENVASLRVPLVARVTDGATLAAVS